MTAVAKTYHYDKPPFATTCIGSIAETILKKRYLKKSDTGETTETPSELFWRVAKDIAEAEYKYKATDGDVEKYSIEFYRLMATGRLQPNTPTLVNAGRDNGLSYSACFVLPVEDDLVKGPDSIYKTLTNMAAIHQSGGGTGFSFSKLRPSGSIVNTTSGVASGPVSFMSLYDASTNVVKQGGTRRGANMGVLRVDHPDIKEFIHSKSDVSKITNFNISVAITSEFMDAVRDDQDFDLVDPRTRNVTKTIQARELFQEITEQAYATGEPGLFFIDEANKHNPVPHLGVYEATNPCGEVPMLPYDTCNLLSMNVGSYVLEVDGNVVVDWTELKKDIYTAVRFIDNVIDQNNYLIPQIQEISSKIRRVGLGIMGWADLLIKLKIPYNSNKALVFAEEFMSQFQQTAEKASELLAEEKGTFPEWEKSAWGPDQTCARNSNGERLRPYKKMRNCDVTMIAPTGTISIFANCSGGIEPIYAVAFSRNQAGSVMLDVNPEFLRTAKDEGWYSKDLIKKIIKTGSIKQPEIPQEIQNVFITSHDVTPIQHIKMQAVFQKNVHQAISKTCNFPKEATVEDIRKAYVLAYELNCKGITVYVDGSRPNQILVAGTSSVEPLKSNPATIRKRPEIIHGFTRKVEFAKLGKVYITINMDENDKLFEVFVQWGRAGSDETTLTEALGRVLSLALQWGIRPKELAKALKGIGGKTVVFHNGNTYSSIPDAVGKTISLATQYRFKRIETEKTDGDHLLQLSVFSLKCPECEAELITAEGCDKCLDCGYSSCG